MKASKFILIILLICDTAAAQTKIGIVYPDSLKRSAEYFSPYSRYQTRYILKNELAIGQPFDSTLNFSYSYFDNDEGADSLGTIRQKQAGLTIIVDTTQEIDEQMYFLKSNKWNGLYDSPKKITYLNAANQLVGLPCDKEWELTFKALPVYIVNKTRERKAVFVKGLYIDIIQEALDTMGKWRPIETITPNICGAGFGWRGLNPDRYIVVTVNRYKGTYKTLLRLKMFNGDTIYYSKPFTGSINYSQMYNKVKL